MNREWFEQIPCSIFCTKKREIEMLVQISQPFTKEKDKKNQTTSPCGFPIIRTKYLVLLLLLRNCVFQVLVNVYYSWLHHFIRCPIDSSAWYMTMYDIMHNLSIINEFHNLFFMSKVLKKHSIHQFTWFVFSHM